MMPLTGRVPLVIGVTGHRDLRAQDLPHLEREVTAILVRLRREYVGENNETPLILISALAEGADRIAARAALALGIHLVAPLPLPAAEYRKDFEPGLIPGAAAEFDQLLSEALIAPIMPFTTGNSLEAVRVDEKKRAEQYRAVGLFIVQHSDVLIALWDGNEIDKPVGGTSEVVAFKREGIPLVVSESAHASLDGSEIGPVIHIVTPRNKIGSVASDVSVSPWGGEITGRRRGRSIRRLAEYVRRFSAHLLGHGRESVGADLLPTQRREFAAWETFDSLALLTREFNSEAAALVAMAAGTELIESSIDSLFTDLGYGGLDEEAKRRGLAFAPAWCRIYGIADTLAQIRQVQFWKDWKLLFVLAFVAFTCFALFSHVRWASNWLLGGYTVAVGIICYVFIRAQVRRHQERFLDYRAFAEALRVAIYWNILGIHSHWSDEKRNTRQEPFSSGANTTGTLASCYPIKQPSELAWIKISLRTLELLHGREKTVEKRKIDAEAHALARRFWVRGQLSYFDRQRIQHDRRAEILEGWALVGLLITPFFLVPLLLSAVGESQLKLHNAFLIAIGIMPGLAAMLNGYSERLALKAQARQYDRMQMLFQRAYELLPQTIDSHSEFHVRALYRELGAEAMKESADWVAIYRQRPIRPVQ